MQLRINTFTVHKKFALQISRGTTAQSTNILLRIQQEDVEGWGEASPFSIDKNQIKGIDGLLSELSSLLPHLEQFHPLQRQEILAKLQQLKVSSSLRAAVDMALHDWLGKKAGLPLWQIWGLNCAVNRKDKLQKRAVAQESRPPETERKATLPMDDLMDDLNDGLVPISVTIGINTPEAALTRLKDWQNTLEVEMLKLKLGNPAGTEADRLMVEAICQAVPKMRITVDANGGWSFKDAVFMSQWLEKRGVEYIEQPLPVALDHQLLDLSQASPLPIFVDESCFTSADIPRLANSVAGVNLKIMKTGGLTEAFKAIQVAKACGLQIMFGCYSDSTLANTAMSHLAPYADYLDLDSHLNLTDDPFAGATIESGCLVPNCKPGIGVSYAANS